MSSSAKPTAETPEAAQKDYTSFIDVLRNETGEDRVKAVLRFAKAHDVEGKSRTYMKNFLPWLEFHSAKMEPHPTVTFRFTVQPDHQNGLHNMHGGATASLFDYCTSVALGLVSRPGHWFFMGVTRNLSLTYLRPAPVGEAVLLECEVTQVGRKLCHLKGRMRRESDGVLLVTCEHDKVSTDPPADHFGKL